MHACTQNYQITYCTSNISLEILHKLVWDTLKKFFFFRHFIYFFHFSLIYC
uniref:Uncharacterized protein n=1 Tax=Octopus bimaculoides TaxID=37653 RepID=A0A0L8I3U5_OCTBM